jgi:hypothetical protein
VRISETDGRLTALDRPTGAWLLGLVFVASGALVLSIALLASEWRTFILWQRLVVIGIGLGHLLGGLYSTMRPAETYTIFDKVTGNGTQFVRPLWKLRPVPPSRFSLDDAREVEIVRSTDSDGDPVFQHRLWLAGSQSLWLQAQPVRGEERVHDEAEQLRRFLGATKLSATAGVRG